MIDSKDFQNGSTVPLRNGFRFLLVDFRFVFQVIWYINGLRLQCSSAINQSLILWMIRYRLKNWNTISKLQTSISSLGNRID